MTVYVLSIWKCLSFPEPLLEHHCFFALVFSNTVQKGDRESLQQPSHETVFVLGCAPDKGVADLPFLLAF